MKMQGERRWELNVFVQNSEVIVEPTVTRDAGILREMGWALTADEAEELARKLAAAALTLRDAGN